MPTPPLPPPAPRLTPEQRENKSASVRKTSLETYDQMIDGKLLSPQRERVYDWIFKHGPCTAMEIEVGLRSKNANKRTSELRDQGVIFESGETTCPVTGRPAILWDVTGKLPVGDLREGKKSPKKAEVVAAVREVLKVAGWKLSDQSRQVLERMVEE